MQVMTMSIGVGFQVSSIMGQYRVSWLQYSPRIPFPSWALPGDFGDDGDSAARAILQTFEHGIRTGRH